MLSARRACPKNDDVGTWADKSAYDQTARDLVGRFHANFTAFDAYVTDAVKAAAPAAA